MSVGYSVSKMVELLGAEVIILDLSSSELNYKYI